MDDILKEIAEAVEEYRRVFPLPEELAPNLILAVRAAVELRGYREELRAALAEVGLPENADLATLIRHHRGNAGAAVAFEMLGAELKGGGLEPLTDAEWRDFQDIPDQGYSHRHWIDQKIALRVAAAGGSQNTAE